MAVIMPSNRGRAASDTLPRIIVVRVLRPASDAPVSLIASSTRGATAGFSRSRAGRPGTTADRDRRMAACLSRAKRLARHAVRAPAGRPHRDLDHPVLVGPARDGLAGG